MLSIRSSVIKQLTNLRRDIASEIDEIRAGQWDTKIRAELQNLSVQIDRTRSISQHSTPVSIVQVQDATREDEESAGAVADQSATSELLVNDVTHLGCIKPWLICAQQEIIDVDAEVEKGMLTDETTQEISSEETKTSCDEERAEKPLGLLPGSPSMTDAGENRKEQGSYEDSKSRDDFQSCE